MFKFGAQRREVDVRSRYLTIAQHIALWRRQRKKRDPACQQKTFAARRKLIGEHRPRIRLTIRQRTRVLQEWPKH